MAYVDMHMDKSQSEANKDSDTIQFVEMTGFKKGVKTETVNQDYVEMSKSDPGAKKDLDIAAQYVDMTAGLKNKTEIAHGYVEMIGTRGNQDATKIDTIELGYVERIGISHERDQKIIMENESAAKIKEENVILGGINFPKSIIIDPENFHTEAKIGEGHFGSVFRGHLDMGAAR